MNKEEIGIGILDVYTQEDLNNCYNSIPKDLKVFVVSDTKNNIPESVENYRVYGNGVPFASLRNWLISQFRIAGLKHFFLINSNQIIKNQNVFENIIKKASIFGTWAMVGPSESVVTIDDEEKNESLSISNKLNADFIYLFNGIVSNVGYFDERFFNTKDLDVVDYILRMREKKVYPPNNYHPIIEKDIDASSSTIQKINYKDMLNADQSVHMSYAYFMFKYQYIPLQNEPAPVPREELLKSLEEIQKNYSKNEQ
jgi:hypothetical protein